MTIHIHLMKNMKLIDRIIRLALAATLLQLGCFWLASPWSFLAFAVAAMMLVTAVTGFCPVYKLLGFKPAISNGSTVGMPKLMLAATMLVILLAGGSYWSVFFTRKIFLEDFNTMNHFYKQALFLTGKDNRVDALSNFEQLKPAFARFTEKYSSYKPYNLKGDKQLESDFSAVSKILADVEPKIKSGDLRQAHLDLEKVRSVFQELFKRNGFSMLSVALVDFHDAMELILAAASSKDVDKVEVLYPEISDKLKIIESEASDDEIKAIRTALDDVLATAKSSQLDVLPAKGDTLKSNFVKVYLKRG